MMTQVGSFINGRWNELTQNNDGLSSDFFELLVLV